MRHMILIAQLKIVVGSKWKHRKRCHENLKLVEHAKLANVTKLLDILSGLPENFTPYHLLLSFLLHCFDISNRHFNMESNFPSVSKL